MPRKGTCESCTRQQIVSQYARTFSRLAALACSPSLPSWGKSSKSLSDGAGSSSAVKYVAKTLWLAILFASFVETCAWELSGTTKIGNTTIEERLSNMTIEFPEISEISGGHNITITNLICKGFTFTGVDIAAQEGSRPPDEGAPEGAIFDLGNFTGAVNGVGLECYGNYFTVEEGKPCRTINECFQGNFFTQIESTSVDLSFAISTTSEQWRYQARTYLCQSAFDMTNFTVSSGSREHVLVAVEKIVNTLAPVLICDELTSLVDVNLTDSLNKVVSETVEPVVGVLKDYESPPKFGKTQCIIASTICAGVFLVYVIVLCTIKYIRNRHSKIADGASATPLLSKLDREQADPSHPQYSHSLSLSPRVHTAWAICVPLALLINIAMFLTSNLSVGASVYVTLSLGPAPESPSLQLPSLFAFTLANSVTDMWKAGVYPLSILIACFSGIWPYVKLMLMLMCWWFPVRWLPIHRRERVLIALDALGKWSLVDSYVLVLMLVAFRLTLPFGDLFQVDIFVQSNIGFYLFLAATIMSLLLTHFTLGLHRQAEDPVYPKHLDRVADPESVASHAYSLGWDYLCQCTKGGTAFLVGVFLVAMGLLCAGAAVNSFDFKFLGLTGAIMRELGQSDTRTYSIISLAMSLPSATFYDPNSFGIHAIQACFLLWTLAMPLLHIVSLIFIWLVPLRPRMQRLAFHIIEIFNAWSALEVFVASVLAALLELETFAQFIVGTKCDPLDAVLEDLQFQDPICFGVEAHLAWGCGILFTSAVIYFIFSTVAMRLCHKALRERLTAVYDQTSAHQIQNPKLQENERRFANQQRESCWNSFWRRTTLVFNRNVLTTLRLVTLSTDPLYNEF